MRPIHSAVLSVILVMVATIAARPQGFEPRWISDAHGCRMWDPAPIPGESIRWAGACPGGFGEGHGTLTWFSAGGALVETDTAEFHRGKLNGEALLAFTNGERFEGRFEDQIPNGRGTYRAFDGEIYSGEWTHGCFMDGKRRMNFEVPARDCALSSDAKGLRRFASVN